MFNYFNPTAICFGRGQFDSAHRRGELKGAEKVLLVTDGTAMRRFGYSDRLKENLSHCEVVEYDSVPANPDFECVRQGIDLARREGITVVVALGGGSSMDAGKAIAFLSPQSASLDDYLAVGAVGASVDRLGFVAIPTTSGTGSEVTPWASIWDRDKRKKYSLADERMFPDCAIVDPSLTLSLPPEITAATGLDALCHAVEAYWSLNSQPVSDFLAAGAIELVGNHLVGAYRDGDNIEHRDGMSLASLLAGLAFSNTKTTACHSISYPLTARFDIPHGIACALTLGAMLAFNGEALGARGDRLAGFLGCDDIESAVSSIGELLEKLNVSPRLRDYGIDKQDIDAILDDGFTPDRIGHNPRTITRGEMQSILEALH
ncbi:MAG: iron-containing alcohol dehydrogenase [Planctomycetes bacterium]|nr:iron-containing alcohol dehydrogenase [Planctomycetota bacterium]